MSLELTIVTQSVDAGMTGAIGTERKIRVDKKYKIIKV